MLALESCLIGVTGQSYFAVRFKNKEGVLHKGKECLIGLLSKPINRLTTKLLLVVGRRCEFDKVFMFTQTLEAHIHCCLLA